MYPTDLVDRSLPKDAQTVVEKTLVDQAITLARNQAVVLRANLEEKAHPDHVRHLLGRDFYAYLGAKDYTMALNKQILEDFYANNPDVENRKNQMLTWTIVHAITHKEGTPQEIDAKAEKLFGVTFKKPKQEVDSIL
jgi:hypothetical protein